MPVSFPVGWDDLDAVDARRLHRSTPRSTALGDGDPWADADARAAGAAAPSWSTEGHAIPVARVAAMHEGKRRRRAAAKAAEES